MSQSEGKTEGRKAACIHEFLNGVKLECVRMCKTLN